MRTHTPIVPSRRRARIDLATSLSNQPKIPTGVVLLRNLVRSTLLTRIGQPWSEVQAALKKLPEERRQVLHRLVRTNAVLRHGQPCYPRGEKRKLTPIDGTEILSSGYYVCPVTSTLRFVKYEPKIEDAVSSITG